MLSACVQKVKSSSPDPDARASALNIADSELLGFRSFRIQAGESSVRKRGFWQFRACAWLRPRLFCLVVH